MQNLKQLEKSRGIVVFAFNSTTVDYVSIADNSSRLASHSLGLPITLVTDVDANPKFEYERIIRVESKTGNFRNDLNGELLEWKNLDRCLVYSLSPYDETILIDVDYLILDDSLLKLFEQDFDYRLMYNNRSPHEPMHQMMGTFGLPQVWATVVLFRKTKLAKQYFNLIKRIQNNYDYYRALFNCTDMYRNDFAFAMANIILNGYCIESHKGIPWNMITVNYDIETIDTKNTFLVVRRSTYSDVITRQNLHIMDKKFLTSDKFQNFVDKVCNESA
jgi:hypothetical protein